MFDRIYSGLGESALIAAIEQAAREEAQAGARKLAAIAELVDLTVEEDDERGMWAFDPWKNAACHVGAALSISQQRASAQMCIATALRYRLPEVAALYLSGRLSARLVSEITWRTHLVTDEVLALVDAALAGKAEKWGSLSDEKLIKEINVEIARHDPDAVRSTRKLSRSGMCRSGPRATRTGPCRCGRCCCLRTPWRTKRGLPGSSTVCVTRIRGQWASGDRMRWARSVGAKTTCRAGVDLRHAPRAVRRNRTS